VRLNESWLLSRTLTVRFGLRNMGVAPAGMEKPIRVTITF
jgi:hypothetical protein